MTSTDEKKFNADVDKALRRAVLKTLGYIQTQTPVDTGRLRNSIQMGEDEEGYYIGTSVEYAEAVELGTQPHKIVAKDKQALFWAGANHPVKSVNHPGTQGHHMFLKGVNQFENYLREELKRG